MMTTLATRIQSSWSSRYNSCVAEVRCAAALAATGHLTSVEYMRLMNMELPSSQDMPSLARLVSSGVLSMPHLYRVMDIRHGAGPGGHQQHGVEKLGLRDGARIDLQTLLQYDGRGKCGEVKCHDDTRDTYKEEMKTWAARVNWGVEENWDVEGAGYMTNPVFWPKLWL